MGGGKARSAAERAGAAVYDRTIINQIMLKFRPIAPKPLGDGEADDPNKLAAVGKKRAKRKYVRINKTKVDVCDNKDDKTDKSVVTLQLLPVTDKISPRSSSRDLNNIPDLNVSGGIRRVVESWVTLECVTDGYDNEGWLGWTDGEKVRNLERDTCPGFLFEGFDEVVEWVNLSYRKMVAEEDEEVVVRVAVKGRFPRERAGFSCRARVAWYRTKQQQQQGNSVSEEKQTVTVPCDVWRMQEYGDGELFACRLDVKAALSLGR